MRNICFKKALVVCIIILFLGVGFQPALANEESITILSLYIPLKTYILSPFVEL